MITFLNFLIELGFQSNPNNPLKYFICWKYSCHLAMKGRSLGLKKSLLSTLFFFLSVTWDIDLNIRKPLPEPPLARHFCRYNCKYFVSNILQYLSKNQCHHQSNFLCQVCSKKILQSFILSCQKYSYYLDMKLNWSNHIITILSWMIHWSS